jgi:hypothetical protein
LIRKKKEESIRERNVGQLLQQAGWKRKIKRVETYKEERLQNTYELTKRKEK